MSDPGHHDPGRGPSRTIALSLGALGVVYGDIGTSPLYAIKECFHGMHAIAVTPDNVLGVLSLIFWSLTMVITVKYVLFITRADNRGEGGIFALLELLPKDVGAKRLRPALAFLALFGAALLYGDGVITPAISVLSAVEGLNVATDAAEPLVVPITCLILFCLFMVQRRGTAGIGRVFGPVMLLWFAVLAVFGVRAILDAPEVLAAVNPIHAVTLFHAQPPARHGRARRGGAVHHRRRGPLRRHGPFRPLGPSSTPGCSSCFPACCSTISARAPACCAIPPSRPTPSTAWCPAP